MINKSFILNKVIENVNENYRLAVANNDTTNAKKHHTNLATLIQLKQQLESSGELDQDVIHEHGRGR